MESIIELLILYYATMNRMIKNTLFLKIKFQNSATSNFFVTLPLFNALEETQTIKN